MLISIKMKQDIEKIIEIPEGVEVSVNEGEVIVKGNGKEAKRKFDLKNFKIEKTDNMIKVFAKKATKREGKLIGTVSSHIKNMISGIKEDFIYKLEIVNVHFPMNVKVEGDKIIIKNFLGEKIERIAKVLPKVKVEVKGNQIIVSSHEKESAGQTAANIEKATNLKGKDRRIYQDGIYIVSRAGKEI